jgi:hypothetical protein
MKPIKTILGLSIVLLVAGSVMRCTDDRTRIPVFTGDEPEITPTQLTCEALVRLTRYDYSINSAMLTPASDETPEYCEVKGQILPEVAFELRLPTRWNQRFLMLGNGLLGGWMPEGLDGAVRQFFAVAGTNTGHVAPQDARQWASFGTDRQKLIDYAYRAIHLTTLTAKEIVGLYYGVPPTYSYFSGCSNGGRQGLMSAQRFPDEFDGILVGEPALDMVDMVISNTWVANALRPVSAPWRREGPADLHVLAERVYAKCDSVDGLEDGLIDDPRRCAFDPSTDLPICGSGPDTAACYSERQVRALEAVYDDLMVGGRRIFPGYPVGPEVFIKWWPEGERSGWHGMRVGWGSETPGFEHLSETFLRYIAFEPREPEFDLFAFDFEEDPARMAWLRPLLDATSPDLSAFRDHGGKLLMYFGWADEAANPLMGVEYYEAVMEEMGSTVPDFFRLFMVPGMFHCLGGVPQVAGGVGVDSVPWLPALVQWVESAAPPERIVGTRKGYIRRAEPDTVGWTRPLCPYPQVARYTGEGSIEDAENFACVAPETP